MWPEPAWANYDYSGPLTEFNMLGNVATQFEGPLEYDPLAGKIINNPKANALLTGEYRAGLQYCFVHNLVFLESNATQHLKVPIFAHRTTNATGPSSLVLLHTLGKIACHNI